MIKKFANDHKEMTVQIVRDLCKIPAPSFGERKRAEFCKAWLENVGAKDVYIDEINNVIFPIGCDGSNEITGSSLFSSIVGTSFLEVLPSV